MSDVKSRVTLLGVLTAVSSTPVKPGKSYPLSVLDHAMGAHQLRIVFYYPSDATDPSCPMEKEKLKVSLSEVLSYYPPVTGRLRRDDDGNWEVKCNDAGVRALEAKVNCTLDEWLRSADAEEEKDLTYWQEMPEDPCIWSPFYIKINEFEGGGIAIGLTCPHMYADPACATLLVKAWSDIHRRAAIANHPFFHPPGLRGRNPPNTNTKSAKYYEAKSKAGPPPHVKMSTTTFRFSDQTVKNLLEAIQPQCPNATPFHALAALFWSSAIRAKVPQHADAHRLSLCVDFRKALHAPLPHGYFGNALHFSAVSLDKSEDQGELGIIAAVIQSHLAGTDEGEYWSTVDWFEAQKEGGRYASPFRMYGPELTCANMEHLFTYGGTFENEKKPMHVSYHVDNAEGEGLILVLPSLEEGLGRMVQVTLPEDQTVKVCRDESILRLQPTILFKGKR